MIAAVLLGFLLAALAPLVGRVAGRAAGAVLALGPLAMFLFFLGHLPAVASGEVVRASVAWVPALGIELSFYLDGLGLLFALLITGIGTLIVLYAGAYLEEHGDRGRFYGWLILFMAAMLGLVLADNVVALFVFWELTSISSYFLIGFDHHREEARAAALQALLVTGGGGLALLAGLVLLAVAGDSLELSVLLGRGDAIRTHALYVPIVVCVLAGACTKSAQFPFHFWLPNAMEAPTPVSAYLHSSTMVKAGVYLVARLNPALGGTELWGVALTGIGTVTMVLGAYLAITQGDLKRILAYSTVSALGLLIALVGVGNLGGPDLGRGAAMAFGAFLLAHALYKATLFLVAGTITHETGEKDVTRLGGLAGAMPLTAAAAALAAVSMAGAPLPPTVGFVAKELLFETTLGLDGGWRAGLTGAAAVTGVLFVIVAGLVAWKPFAGARVETPEHPHDPPWPMTVGPMLLALVGLAAGLAPGIVAEPAVAAVAASLLVAPIEAAARGALIDGLHLVLWHGVNLPLAIGTAVVLAGIGGYAARRPVLAVLARLEPLHRVGPAACYECGLAGLIALAAWQTRIIQNGKLRTYLRVAILTTVGLTGWQMLRMGDLPLLGAWPALSLGTFVYEHFYELAIAALILAGTYGAVHSASRLTAIAALGVVGYGVALTYLVNGAPDLAITQFLVETLTVILFVLVFYHLPHFPRISSVPARVRDVAVAGAAGATMTVLTLLATSVQTHPKISDFFVERSVDLGHGRNVVNVILVDFRAIDTLGEITVLAIAAVGVFALLKLRPLGQRRRRAEGHS